MKCIKRLITFDKNTNNKWAIFLRGCVVRPVRDGSRKRVGLR